MTALTESRFDASDWLSPIIIKELRQGMRGRFFQSAFLFLQLGLIVVVSGALVATSLFNTDAMEMFSFFFWVIVGAPLVLAIPMSGLNALRGEIQSNSLELVYLTRLSPWRIVAGKWAALAAQSLLFAFAVLPYLVLRYFLGGIDLLDDLRILLLLLGVCFVFSAVTVGLSAHPPRIVRSAFGFCIIFGFQFIPFFFFSHHLFGVSSGVPGGIDANPYLLAAIVGSLALLLMLEVGAAKISPAAASGSLRIRVIGLIAFAAAILLHFAGNQTGAALIAVSPLLFIICLVAINETPRWIPSIYQPFIRRGIPGRLAGFLFFYPGWLSGVIYTSAIFLVLFLFAFNLSSDLKELFPYFGIYVSLIFTVALTRLIRPHTPNGFRWFMAIQAGMVLLALIYSLLYHLSDLMTPAIAAFPPTTLLIALASDVVRVSPVNTMILIAVLFASLAAIAVRALSLLPALREMEIPPQADPATTA